MKIVTKLSHQHDQFIFQKVTDNPITINDIFSDYHSIELFFLKIKHLVIVLPSIFNPITVEKYFRETTYQHTMRTTAVAESESTFEADIIQLISRNHVRLVRISLPLRQIARIR